MTIKRPLIYVAGGFVLGEVLALLPVDRNIGILILLLFGILYLCRNRSSSRSLSIGKSPSLRSAESIGLLLLFCFVGYARMEIEQYLEEKYEYLILEHGVKAEVQGTIKKISEKNTGYAITLADCSVLFEDEQYPVEHMLVYIEKEEFERENDQAAIRIGMGISAWGRPERPTQARNPGEFDYRKYYRAFGIRYQMFGNDLFVRDDHYIPYSDFIYRIRLFALDILEKICDPEDLGIFQASILGEKSAMDDTVQTLYQRSGIAHLLAISGLHISIVGLGAYKTFRKVGLGYGGAGVMGVLLIVSYGMLTGFAPSVIRAVAMILIYMLAQYLGRSYDMLSAAACIGVCLLLESPYLLLYTGFLLSFGAIGAIGGLGPWLIKVMKPLKLCESLVMGLAIQMITYPIILYQFFQYPIYGIFLNLLVIPLMAYVIISGMAGIIFGSISLNVGIVALGAGHYILGFYLWLCRLFEYIPGSNLVIGRPELWQVGLYYAVMGGMLWWVKRKMENKQTRVITVWGGLLCGITLCFFLLWQMPVSGLEVTVLDVGQGDGICIRTNSVVILVDGGSSSNKKLGEYSLEPYLKSNGIQTIDFAIVSHGDADHTSGLQYLLEENKDIKIKHLILPWLGREDEAYETLIRLMEKQGGKIHWMQRGEQIQADDLVMTCLYHGNEKDKKDNNEHSLVLRIDYKQIGILLTGDMSSKGETEMIRQIEAEGKKHLLEDIQILKVAHHGSKHSNSELFLETLKPNIAVVSSGMDNSYGHPHEETLERLKQQGIAVYMTSESGALTLHSDGSRVNLFEFIPAH